ncbi:MAG: hypothetical protein IPN84_00110 [Sphingomonadales bacterium]|nr:hypothetical protein [Sphingomonadales bacterium]
MIRVMNFFPAPYGSIPRCGARHPASLFVPLVLRRSRSCSITACRSCAASALRPPSILGPSILKGEPAGIVRFDGFGRDGAHQLGRDSPWRCKAGRSLEAVVVVDVDLAHAQALPGTGARDGDLFAKLLIYWCYSCSF